VMTYRTRNVMIAAGLAVLAVVFMMIYLSQVRGETDLGKELVSVFVASRDINEGTPGSSLGGAFVEKQVPRKVVVPGAISSPDQVGSLIATEQTLAGEQVTTRRFGPLAAAGVRSQIKRTHRTMQLVGSPDQVLEGTLKAGDRVDVVATWNVPENCNSCHVSRIIIRDALVLKTSEDLGAGNGSLGTNENVRVQLQLTDDETEKMFWIVNNGEWWFDLRPVLKPRDSRQGYWDDGRLLQDGLRRRNR
jgi:Flp pilus assembly protein CpaB